MALTEFQAFVKPKESYKPQDDIQCPDTPYFIQDAMDPFATPLLTAPRLCPLCGKGFVNRRALDGHAEREHGGMAEMRKRIFWHAEQTDALPLSMKRKRNMLANLDQEIRCCRPGGTGELEPRRDVACVVCARKDWLNTRFPVYLWKTLPGKTLTSDACQDEDKPEVDKSDGEESDSESEDYEKKEEQNLVKQRLHCDQSGIYYFGEPSLVNQLLAVEIYHQTMPTIPLEELHASSAQHPSEANFRWLLHSRRVPLADDTSGH